MDLDLSLAKSGVSKYQRTIVPDFMEVIATKSEMNQRNILILSLSLSFGIGLYAFPEFVAHVPDLGIKLGLLLTTGLIPAGLLAFILNATLPKKSK